MTIKRDEIGNDVLELMIEQGGSFSRKLAELYYVADSENSKRLEDTFSDIFSIYEHLAKVKVKYEATKSK